MMQDRD